MIVLYVLGYFNRNKQNSYAALIIKLSIYSRYINYFKNQPLSGLFNFI